MNILFLSRWYPYPPNNGSKIRIWNILQTLVELHQVTLVSFIDPNENLNGFEIVQSSLDSVTTVIRKTYSPKSLKSILGFFSPLPRSIMDTYAQEMEQVVRQKLSDECYDLILASQWEATAYIPKDSNIPVLLDELELALFYEGVHPNQSLLGDIRQGLTWWKHTRYIKKIFRMINYCTVVSDFEYNLVKKIDPNFNNVEIIPNCINLPEYTARISQPEMDTLIFTGSMAYLPNYQAILWFINHVFPKLKTAKPNVQLLITGKTNGIQLPRDENIHLTGYIDDIKALISRSTISIAPIFSGGGTRYKILEAMAIGTPVVATRKGVEGLAVKDKVHLLLADDADNFAANILRLLNDANLRDNITRTAYDLVASKYDWNEVKYRFLELVDKATKN